MIMKACVLTMIMFAIRGVHSVPGEKVCTDSAKMPNLTERYSQLNFDISNNIHSSFGIHEQAYKIFNQQHQSEPTSIADEKRYYIYGARDCRIRKSKSLAFGSTCPWRIMVTTDEDRFPRQMFTAECACKSCRGRKKSKFQCQPIIFPTKVLRQKYATGGKKECEDVNGEVTFKYEEVFEPIVTGCTCSRESKAVQSTLPETLKTSL